MNPFAAINTIVDDAAVLIASLVALGVTVLCWKLGRAWIWKSTMDEEFEKFKEREIDDTDYEMLQDELF
jgi:hypothetical protein